MFEYRDFSYFNQVKVSAIYRLFKLLQTELKRLGCHVIHATPRRLIVNTKKKTIEDGVGYVDFIERTLVQKEYFQVKLLYPS